MASNHSLTYLELDGYSIGDKGVARIADAIKINRSLACLHLGESGVGDDGAPRLAEALTVNQTLTHLGLNRNSIGDKGAKFLVQSLEGNKTLLDLQLVHNQIQVEGVKALARGFCKQNRDIVLVGSFEGYSGKTLLCMADALALSNDLKDHAMARTIIHLILDDSYFAIRAQ